MNNKKFFIFGAILSSLAIGAVVLVTSRDANTRLGGFVAHGTETPYSFEVLEDLNVAETSGNAITDKGSQIGFTYSNFEAAEGVWGKASSANAGVIKNTAPINSITKVGVLASAAVTLELGWAGDNYVRSVSVAASATEDPKEFNVADTAEAPSHLKITVPANATLSKLVITYECEEVPARGEVYQIATPAQLNGFAKLVNAGNVSLNGELTADIDMTGVTFGHCIGINQTTARFSGTFDGQNHTITGLSVEREQGLLALFGNAVDATIRNVKLANVNLHSTSATSGTAQRVAGIVGRAERATIENCHVLSGSINGYQQNGGIVAVAFSTTVKNCSNAASVSTTTGNIAGGIVGMAFDGDCVIENCTNSGVVTSAAAYAGGIIGQAYCGTISNVDYESNLYVTGCVNEGTVTVATTDVGGILGVTTTTGTVDIVGCKNEGTVNGGTSDGCGGIVGRHTKQVLF